MDKLCCESAENNSLAGTSDGSTIGTTTGEGSQRQQLIECDYDTQCPRLYKLIEEAEWDHVLYYLTEGQFYDTTFFPGILGNEPESPFLQTCTWVTALDEDGNVEWCQLPVHAALTFQAPLSVIQKLVEIYPKSVRCADDADMLPLHYAFRFGAEDDVLALLLEKFPQALNMKAVKDRLPLTLAHYGPRSDMGRIIDRCIGNSIRDARELWEEEYDNMFKQLKSSADKAIYQELQKTKARLENTQNLLAQATEEIAFLKEQQAAIESEKEQQASRILSASIDDTQKVVRFSGFTSSGVGSDQPLACVTATATASTAADAAVSSI
mmetsp:Transcript_18261/g.44100  ORF Transcript_18261/g.44100 Transcript_18261/m.44100 type:complete len:324 (-) Transcript_18261:117-1088(-)